MSDENKNKEISVTPTGGALINPNELNTAGSAAAAMQEIQAAVVMAKQFPRNETEVWAKLMESCKKPTMAAIATYAYRRGGNDITGPSVQLARLMAQRWGNIRFGLNIVAETDESVHIRGWAWDMETNDKSEADDRFKKLVQRKQKGGGTKWIKPDERDLRELINRRGAILKRNCLLEILPRDLTDDAVLVCQATVKGNMSDPKAVAKNLILQFQDHRVTVAMLNEYVGREDWDVATCAHLQEVLTSLKDGNSKRDDHFSGAQMAANQDGDQQAKPDESKKLNLSDLAAREGEE